MEKNYEPISMWGYFWLQILYAIPVIGFIFLLIHAISHPNVNRKNFARSYFCILIIVGIIIGIIFILGGAEALLSLGNQ